MKRIAIQDANIIIDLIHIDLFFLSLDLEFRFFTTDIIHFELNDHQSSIIQNYDILLRNIKQFCFRETNIFERQRNFLK